MSFGTFGSFSQILGDEGKVAAAEGGLSIAENAASGDVKVETYLSYIRHMGSKISCRIIAFSFHIE